MIFKLGAIRPQFRYGKIGLLLLDIAILLGFFLAISCLLLAAYILSVAYCSDFWVLFAFSLISFLAAYILYKRLRQPVYTKFSEASQIIATESSRPVTLRFPGVMGWSGTLVELIDSHSAKNSNRIISIGLPKTIKTPKTDLEVNFWSDARERSSTVVVEITGQYLVGAIRSQVDMHLESLRMNRMLLSLLWFGCICGLTIAIYMAFENNRLNQEIGRAVKSHDFPTVEAHIISSQNVETRVNRGKARVHAWYPHIEYAFSLGEEYRTGNRYTVSPEIYFDKKEVEEIVLKYPPGSIHDLYYDPDDTSFTVLKPGHQDSLIDERRVFLTKWLAILIATIALSIVFWQGRKRLLPEILAIQNRVYGRPSSIR